MRLRNQVQLSFAFKSLTANILYLSKQIIACVPHELWVLYLDKSNAFLVLLLGRGNTINKTNNIRFLGATFFGQSIGKAISEG